MICTTLPGSILMTLVALLYSRFIGVTTEYIWTFQVDDTQRPNGWSLVMKQGHSDRRAEGIYVVRLPQRRVPLASLVKVDMARGPRHAHLDAFFAPRSLTILDGRGSPLRSAFSFQPTPNSVPMTASRSWFPHILASPQTNTNRSSFRSIGESLL